MNILETIEDKNLFGPWFRNSATWTAWRAFLAALFGLDMDYRAKRVFRECTRRSTSPRGQVSEAWMVIGRRGGKSFISALIAVFLACFADYTKYLQPGETGVVMVICPDRKQARVVMRYVSALMNNVSLLKPLIAKETLQGIELTNAVNIEVHTASFRTVRGYTVISAIVDEIAFLRTEDAANPDDEIIAALRPAMSTIPGAMLLCLSSPYARKGALWTTYKDYFGKDSSDLLVWQAGSRVMNPSIPQSVIDRAMEKDPSAAQAEYLAQFRSDIESYIAPEAIEAVTIPGRFELAPVPGVKYQAFCDPSGGSADSFTLAISHEEDGRKVLDVIREVKPPFNPDSVVKEFAELLNKYWLNTVSGDRFGGVWPQAKFKEHGVTYKVAEKPKSDLYRELLPLINSAKCELLDNKRLFNQLTSLERRTGRGGKDTIDHPHGAHDDIANAIAGVMVSGIAVKRAGTWGSGTAQTKAVATTYSRNRGF